MRLSQFPRSASSCARLPLRVGAGLRAIARLLPALLPVLAFVPLVLLPPLNHDVAAVLSFSERWLAGEHLYADLIDVNPPLIYVLNLIPAALEAVTPLSGPAALQLCVVVWGLLAWGLALRVRERDDEGPAERALLDVLPGLFLFDAGYDFGQREHLMAVAALPYVLAAARRAASERPSGRLGAALLAAIGFALKPYFLGIPALVEAGVLVACWRRGGRPALRAALRDPVPWILAAVWLGYLASLPTVFPDYLNVVMPLVWGYYLDLGGLSVWDVLLVPRLATAMLLLAVLLWVLVRRGARADLTRSWARPWMLALAALGALAAAVVQHKGWSYHIVPIEMFACGLGGVLAAAWLDAAGAVRGPAGGPHVAAALAGLFALYAVANGDAPWIEIGYPQSDVAQLAAVLRSNAEGERVLVLSPGIPPIFPALNYAQVHLTLRTMNMWLLQGAYGECLPDGRRYREVWEMGRAEFFVYRTVAEDFARAPPAAVVVDKEPGIPWCGSEFDFLAYFGRHPLFAEVWSHYRLIAEWGRYRVYTRKD